MTLAMQEMATQSTIVGWVGGPVSNVSSHEWMCLRTADEAQAAIDIMSVWIGNSSDQARIDRLLDRTEILQAFIEGIA